MRDTPIVVLDEPTSFLDVQAEQDVFKRFRHLAAGKTTILISHRLSTVRMADRIYVLQDGRIAESGRHDELIARGAGLCAALRDPGVVVPMTMPSPLSAQDGSLLLYCLGIRRPEWERHRPADADDWRIGRRSFARPEGMASSRCSTID